MNNGKMALLTEIIEAIMERTSVKLKIKDVIFLEEDHMAKVIIEEKKKTYDLFVDKKEDKLQFVNSKNVLVF